MNPRLAQLADYPFQRLNDLLSDLEPGAEPIVMSIGEPQTPVPPVVAETLAAHAADWGRYAPIDGSPAFRAAAAGYLERRFGLPHGLLDADRHVTPCAGTREGLFMAGLAAVPPETAGGDRPAVLLPNPFYHAYLAAAVMSGAEPRLLDATARDRFAPDLSACPPALLDRAALAYLCNPANPSGASADPDTLAAALRLARAHDFVLVVDECYSEIYHHAPSVGALRVAADLHTGDGDPFDRLLVTHSLSKRSGVPGLRAGVVAGDAALIAALRRILNWGGVAVPRPVLAAATALWEDDSHVATNRARYRHNMELAEAALTGRRGFAPAEAGFFLWLEVDDGEAAARRLWQQIGVKAMPGAYMARADETGRNPATGHLRLAMVHDPVLTETAVHRLATAL